MDWINIISGVFALLGLSGCGILFYRQERQKKELENNSVAISNEASSNAEWINLYREVKNELKDQRDAKIELRNEIADLRVEVERLRAWRCERTNCLKRRPPSPITMTEDHTND